MYLFFDIPPGGTEDKIQEGKEQILEMRESLVPFPNTMLAPHQELSVCKSVLSNLTSSPSCFS